MFVVLRPVRGVWCGVSTSVYNETLLKTDGLSVGATSAGVMSHVGC